ncbi:RNA recognition motif domain-containing protein [Alteromonas flava]|uniref:RNA recognition motif domain-containing protein n=1 Tax=Alteromonas flava TaxID=2048003 RepID=UPI000C290EAA|nr:RNA-binding protein [Alteromonas flava]
MNVKFFHCVIVAVALAVLTFFAADYLITVASTKSVLAALVLLAGLLTPFIAQFFSSNASSFTADSSEAAGDVTTLYVGNLPYRANEDAVKEYFEAHATVQSVRLMKDKRTGKRKGYGFVEVISNDVSKAINKLNDSVFQDRTLKVRYAKDKVAH